MVDRADAGRARRLADLSAAALPVLASMVVWTLIYGLRALTEERIAEVLAATADGRKFEPTWPVDVTDAAGHVVATVDKTLYIRCKVSPPPSAKLPA